MSPYRPELMVFVSPKKDMELRSPISENTILIKKKLLKSQKIQWKDNMHVELVFSDPTSDRIFTVGGLGDSGSDLGLITFYDYEGAKKELQVKDVLPKLEELSSAFADFSNFPWISMIEITDTKLLIWVCDKALVELSFKNLGMSVVPSEKEPAWVTKNKGKMVTENAAKLQWKLKN